MKGISKFQIHLSTCIVLMFDAGVLLWMNFRQYRHSPHSIIWQGWPAPAYIDDYENFSADSKKWDEEGVMIDAIYVMAFLIMLGVTIEFIIRNCDAEKARAAFLSAALCTAIVALAASRFLDGIQGSYLGIQVAFGFFLTANTFVGLLVIACGKKGPPTL